MGTETKMKMETEIKRKQEPKQNGFGWHKKQTNMVRWKPAIVT